MHCYIMVLNGGADLSNFTIWETSRQEVRVNVEARTSRLINDKYFLNCNEACLRCLTFKLSDLTFLYLRKVKRFR